jgi:hypothetical protein
LQVIEKGGDAASLFVREKENAMAKVRRGGFSAALFRIRR